MLALFFFFRSHCRWICYFYFRRSIPCGTQCLLFVLYERRQRIYLWADFCFRHYLIPSRLSFNLDGVRVKCLRSFYRTRFVIDYISWTHLQLITVARVLFPCVSQFRSFKTRLWSEYWWMPAILSLSQANQLNRTETVKSAAMKCLFWLVDPVLLYFYVDNEIFSVSHIIRDLLYSIVCLLIVGSLHFHISTENRIRYHSTQLCVRLSHRHWNNWNATWLTESSPFKDVSYVIGLFTQLWHWNRIAPRQSSPKTFSSLGLCEATGN